MAAYDSPEPPASSPPSPSSCAGAESEAAPSSAGAESEPSAESDAQSEAATDVPSPSGAESEASAESEPDAEVSSNAESDTAGLASEAADSTPAITAAKAELDMDTKAGRPTTSGSKATAASATKKKIRKTGKVEQFEAHAFGTLEEHAASHDFPAHAAKRGPCKFWRNRWQWSAEFQSSIPCRRNRKHGLCARAALPFAHSAPHTRDLHQAPD